MTRTLLLATAAATAVGVAWYGYSRWNEPVAALVLPGAVEVQEVRLGSKIGGRVAEVVAIEGDHVKAGQPLVRFEAPELEAQRDQLEARLRQMESLQQKAVAGPLDEEKEAARAAAKAAEAKSKMMEKGFRDEDKRQAEAALNAALADHEWASQEWTRVQGLARTRNATQTEVDLARSNLDRAKARVEEAVARKQIATVGMREEERESAKWEAQRLLALSKLTNRGTREEDLAVAQYTVKETVGKLREIEANLAETVVRAPEDAVVEVVAVRKGDLVPPNQPVVRILRAADLWVKVYVPETDLGLVKLGQEVDVTVDSHPGRTFKGRVSHIAGVSEFTPRNIQSADQRKHQVFGIKVLVENSEGVFKSGMAAQVYVPLDAAAPAQGGRP
jgi:HlyD family secretion protein